jgi:AcrR family transcriptional regulator
MTAVVAPAPARHSERVDDVRARAIAALLTCVARHGLAKTTLDDVAREAGCARATLYRHFGDKGGLVETTVRAEADRVAAVVRTAAGGADSLAGALAAVIATGARELRDHAAFGFLVAFEPETILPHLSFNGFDRLLAMAAPTVAPAFDPYLPSHEAERLAEWTVRVVLCCGGPLSPIDLTDDAAARRFVDSYLLSSASSTTRG